MSTLGNAAKQTVTAASSVTSSRIGETAAVGNGVGKTTGANRRASPTTAAPSRANDSAIAAPSPLEAPVTTAVRPVKRCMAVLDSDTTTDPTPVHCQRQGHDHACCAGLVIERLSAGASAAVGTS